MEENIHWGITILIVLVIVYATYYLGWKRFDSFSINHGPEVLTTLGIFGCFLGVAISLYTLSTDIGSLTKSIPSLLGGMKTAFIGSLFGVLGALIIRWKHYGRKDDEISAENNSREATTTDLVIAIQSLQKGLVGSEEGTLLTQIKLQRQEANDQLSKLRDSFDKFATHMVENNQKAIIEALENVIKDFNQKLTEQFGENFKQLNSAVGALLTWQQQYKEELELVKMSQQQTALDMKIAVDSFSQLVERSSEFTKTAENLRKLMEGMDKQKDVLFTQEKALSELLSTMKDITPQFAEKMNAMLIDLNNGVSAIQGQTTDILKNFGVQNQTSNAELKELLVNVVKSTQTTLQDNLKENASVIKESVIALDKALQTELNNALVGLGSQLAALSEKFVSDYLPLTEKLKNVLEISKKI